MSVNVVSASQAALNPAATGSLFSCSRSDVPCHHFCLRHSEPLKQEVEEWFMTDEVEEENGEDEKGQESSGSGEDFNRDMMEEGLLDQLLDEAYAHYYDEPDEWEELADWYTNRMISDGPFDDEEETDQPSSTSGAAPERGFHPAWRQEPVGTSGASSAASASPSGQTRRSSEPEVAGHGQARGVKRRDWAGLVDEQEREEEMELSTTSQQNRRGSAGWSEAARVRECELYETFNDLFLPDPESGRL
ncbi:uncharacterized protein LOC110974235 [Acanthaster planci]|uniref:Uncharacterized protein LOC110974235 n=1 Tax=Acanthaster planci TaxID=133434 RepID=A0A8B7XN58_ACAPL|nr:uncharacterized protein LOC110974235 [Acanthaster planci]